MDVHSSIDVSEAACTNRCDSYAPMLHPHEFPHHHDPKARLMVFFQQLPSTEDLEQLVGADEITLLDFVFAGALIFGSFVVARLVRRVVRWAVAKFPHVSPEIAAIVGRASGWVVILMGIVYALVVIGVNMVPALMILLIVAIVTFFAGRGILENFSTGLVLQGTPMFAAGDEIITESGVGEVMEITGRTVVIRTPDGERLHIPNKIVIAGPVTNLTARGPRRSSVDVGVAYGTDLDLAGQAIIDAARRCSRTHSHPAPEVLFSEFGDDSIKLTLLFWHDSKILDELRAIDAVGRSIAVVFAERGIVIAFPQRTLWWGESGSDGSDTSDR